MTDKKKLIDWRISCVAILCLTGIELMAITNGINGTMRSIIFMLIALIVGVQLPQFKFTQS